MKKSSYKSELAKKSLGLGAILFLGVSAHSFAQTPAPLPPLGAFPDIAVAANDVLPPLPAPVNTAKTNVAPTVAPSTSAFPALMPLPPIDAKNTSVPATPTAMQSTPPALPPLPDAASAANPSPVAGNGLPAPVADVPVDTGPLFADLPSIDDALVDKKPSRPKVAATDKNKAPTENGAENKDTAANNGIPPLPLMLPMPGLQSTAPLGNNAGLPSLPMPLLGAESPQKIKLSEDEQPKKSWQTVLAPTDVPVETHFNFRRQLLPATIYRTEYAEQNLHLPVAITRQDYEGLLFTSVMRNDVEGTRSLLNAGTNINAVNENGDSLLTVAHLSGAEATEKLLLARGGR